MIADALKLEIERYVPRMRTTNPLFCRAADGTMTKHHLHVYLSNLKVLVVQTLPHLARASKLARERNHTALATHYDAKAAEEIGHDAWAERDLLALAARAAESHAGAVPSVRSLIALIESAIDEDPALYLSYCLFAEYFVALLGPEWLMMLEERCGIARSSMTFMANHAELDRDHAEEGFEAIDRLVNDPAKLPRMRRVVLETIEHFHRFCAEAIDLADGELRDSARVSAA